MTIDSILHDTKGSLRILFPISSKFEQKLLVFFFSRDDIIYIKYIKNAHHGERIKSTK